jgi:hypothetical protein
MMAKPGKAIAGVAMPIMLISAARESIPLLLVLGCLAMLLVLVLTAVLFAPSDAPARRSRELIEAVRRAHPSQHHVPGHGR